MKPNVRRSLARHQTMAIPRRAIRRARRSQLRAHSLRRNRDTIFSIEAALEGVGLAYTFDKLALPHLKAKRLKRVLTPFSPTFPGFYLYYPSRRNQSTKLKALVEFAGRRKF